MNIKSRKFIVWLVWVLLVVASFVFTKQVSETLIGSFCFVSLVYIGGNVLQKYGAAKFGIK